MANRLVRPVDVEYIPGQEYIPSRPAYCTTVTKTVTYTEQTTSYNPSTLPGGSGGNQFDGYGSFDQVLRGGTESETKTKEVTEEVCYDAVEGQEGREAEYINDRGEDWQAGAVSIDSIVDGGAFTFYLPSDPRVLVGLTYEDNGASYSDAAFALLVRTQSGVRSVDLVMNGATVAQQVAYYSPGDPVTLGRTDGEFVAYVGNEEVAREPAPSSLPTKLDVLLYTSGDYVDNPAVASIIQASASGGVGFRAALSLDMGVTGAVGFSVTSFEDVDGEYLAQPRGAVGFALTVSGVTVRNQNSGVGSIGFYIEPKRFEQANLVSSLPRLGATAADYAYGEVDANFAPLGVDGTGGVPDLELQGVKAGLLPARMTSSSITGSVGDVDQSLSPMAALTGDYTYGEAEVTLGALTTYSDWGITDDPLFYGYAQELIMGAYIYTEPVVLVSYTEELELGTAEFTVLVAVDEASIEGLILDDSLAFGEFVERSIESGLDLSTTSGSIPQEVLQYAFNVANGAATRYSGFDFISFTHTNGRTFAVGKDGLYELEEQAGDDGQPISAMVDFGATSFGTSARKYLETLYLGIDTDGQVYAKVYADGGKERIYRAIQPGPTRRVRTARGISAREWQVKLELVDVNEVDLSDIEFVVAASSRRWAR